MSLRVNNMSNLLTLLRMLRSDNRAACRCLHRRKWQGWPLTICCASLAHGRTSPYPRGVLSSTDKFACSNWLTGVFLASARCAVYFTTIFNLARKIPREGPTASQVTSSEVPEEGSQGIQASVLVSQKAGVCVYCNQPVIPSRGASMWGTICTDHVLTGAGGYNRDSSVGCSLLHWTAAGSGHWVP